MTVPADNTAVLEYGVSKEDVKEAISITKHMVRATKDELQRSILPAINKQTVLDLALRQAHINREAQIIPDADPKILDVQRAADNTEPLLKAVGADDLSRMVRNAEQRERQRGGEEDGYGL